MSRRLEPPAMTLFDLGSAAACAVAPALSTRARAVEPADLAEGSETDRRLVEMWLHGKSTHTQRAYRRSASRFLAFVAKPLSEVTLGDLQDFSDALVGKASSRAQVVASVTALLSFGWRLGALRVNVGLALTRVDAPDRLADRILAAATPKRKGHYRSSLRSGPRSATPPLFAAPFRRVRGFSHLAQQERVL